MTAPARPLADPAPLADARAQALFLGLLGAGYLALWRFGAPALAALALSFGAALPLVLPSLGGALRREPAGALFVLFAGAYVETLDDVFGTSQVVSTALVLLGAAYLGLRRRDALDVARRPIALLLALVLAQELVSGWALGDAPPLALAANRLSIFISFACAAVLTRRPEGRTLVPALLILAAALSLPVLARELVDPQQLQLAAAQAGSGARGGGFYAQQNNAGLALDFAAAGAAALFLDRRLRGAAFAGLALLLLGGVLCTVSRGALAIYVALAAAAAVSRLRLRLGLRGALGGVGLAVAAALLLAPPAGRALAAANDALAERGLTDLSRLEEVTAALGGRPDELIDGEDSRLPLVDVAIDRIAMRPVFGWGTGRFMQDGAGPHDQLLQILGENGVVGGLLYAAFVLALFAALRRAPPRLRMGGYLVGGVWLLAHALTHDLLEFRFFVLPAGYLAGLDAAPREAA